MKTLEALKWICRECINGEDLNLLDVPEEGEREWQQNEEWWVSTLGGYPPCPIPEGLYLCYFLSMVGADITDEYGNVILPDAQIEICGTGENGFDYIYLYKLEG